MTTLREAAQQALEALQAYGSHAPNCDHLVLLTSLPPQRKPCSCGLSANITALRAALAEPVALETVYQTIIHWDEGGGKRSRRELARRIVDLYAAPPQRKPLTREEAIALWADKSDGPGNGEIVSFARAIERAHGIKE